MNPYTGQDFFGFFCVLFSRLGRFLLGSESIPLVSDEIQCLVLIFLSLSLAFLGSFLVVKQMTMLANALSHTLLLGIVLTFLLLRLVFGGEVSFELCFTSMTALWIAAVITGIGTTCLAQYLIRRFRVQEDASIALVFTFLFAVGILLVTLFTKNMHLGVEALMGNIDALGIGDLRIAIYLAFGVWGIGICFFRGFFACAFDESFANSIGFPVGWLNYLLVTFTAAVAIASFRAVGVLLFLSFLVTPVLIARFYTHSLKKMIAYSFGISALASLIAVALARHMLSVYHCPLSTSGIVVTILFCFFLLHLGFFGRNRALAI